LLAQHAQKDQGRDDDDQEKGGDAQPRGQGSAAAGPFEEPGVDGVKHQGEGDRDHDAVEKRRQQSEKLEQIQTLRANPQEAFINKLPASVRSAWERTDKVLDNAGVDIQDVLLRNIEGLGHQLSATGAAVLKNLVFFIFQTFVMLFTLFFLFRDGARLLHQLVQLIPMESVHKEHILNRLNQTLTAVVRGMFITASVQGLLAGIGFAVAGVRFSVLLGFATAFMALVPLVGATAVWAPG
jgi:predicted PurR-regulated permease PerM